MRFLWSAIPAVILVELAWVVGLQWSWHRTSVIGRPGHRQPDTIGT